MKVVPCGTPEAFASRVAEAEGDSRSDGREVVGAEGNENRMDGNSLRQACV